MNKKFLFALLIVALVSQVKAQVTNLVYINPGVPGVTAGDQLYIATLKINQNVLAISNAINTVNTTTNNAGNVFTTVSNYTYALFNINSNSIVTLSNSFLSSMTSMSNGVFRAASTGTNIFYWSPTNDYTTISNSLYNNKVNCKHYFRDGTYLHPGYYVSSPSPDSGFFNFKNATNLTIEGIGNPIFTATNCFGISSAYAPDTNYGGTLFNFQNYNNLTIRNISIVWTNVAHSSTTGVGQSAIVLGGTNCNGFLADHVIIRGHPDQGIAMHLPGWDVNHSNHVFYRCEFYDGGYTNILTAPNTFDGACIYGSPGLIVDSCVFQNCSRGIEIEASATPSLFASPYLNNMQIIGNKFIDMCDTGIYVANHHQLDNSIIRGNIFVSSIARSTFTPTGFYGGPGNRMIISDNLFSGGFYSGLYFTPSSGTNRSISIRGNTFTSNLLSIIVLNASSAQMQDIDIRGNKFNSYVGAALWAKGAKYLTFAENHLLNGDSSGASQKFDVWIRADTTCEVTNLSIFNNTFSRTNTGSYTNIGIDLLHGGRDYDIRDNRSVGNQGALLHENVININTNLDNIPVNNLIRTNMRHRVVVNGSFRLDATSADASMGLSKYTRSNGVWTMRIVERAFAGNGSLVHEVPFSMTLNAGDLFCATNITGSGCVTNWTYELR